MFRDSIRSSTAMGCGGRDQADRPLEGLFVGEKEEAMESDHVHDVRLTAQK